MEKAVSFLVKQIHERGILRSRLLELFCHVDDFWKSFAPTWKRTLLQTGQIKRQRSGQLAESEIMTILIHFHQSHYRDFKAFYVQHVLSHLHSEFASAGQLQPLRATDPVRPGAEGFVPGALSWAV